MSDNGKAIAVMVGVVGVLSAGVALSGLILLELWRPRWDYSVRK
jgi:threonine/homoserine efflux transporter RhtA